MTAIPPPPPLVAPPERLEPPAPLRAYAFAAEASSEVGGPAAAPASRGRFIASQTSDAPVSPAYIPPDAHDDRPPRATAPPTPNAPRPTTVLSPAHGSPTRTAASASASTRPFPATGYSAVPVMPRIGERGFGDHETAATVQQSQTTRTKMIASILGGLVVLVVPAALWFTRSQPAANGVSTPGRLSDRDYERAAARTATLTDIDVAPYESCIRATHYSFAALDSIMLGCISETDNRLRYATWVVEDASKQHTAGTGNAVSAEYQACMIEQLTEETFVDALRHPRGSGLTADKYAASVFAAAGGACASKR